MSELQTDQTPPIPEAGKGDEAFLIGAFAVGVHFLGGFFVAASIFLLAMPMEPPIVRKVMLGFSIVFSVYHAPTAFLRAGPHPRIESIKAAKVNRCVPIRHTFGSTPSASSRVFTSAQDAAIASA